MSSVRRRNRPIGPSPKSHGLPRNDWGQLFLRYTRKRGSYARRRESRLLRFPIMTMARHIVALLQSHVAGDEERFLSVATQLAAHEARQGHGKLAQQLQELISAAK